MSEIKTPVRVAVSEAGFVEAWDADGKVVSTHDFADHINAAAAREAQLREALVVATEAIGGPGATGSGECRLCGRITAQTNITVCLVCASEAVRKSLAMPPSQAAERYAALEAFWQAQRRCDEASDRFVSDPTDDTHEEMENAWQDVKITMDDLRALDGDDA